MAVINIYLFSIFCTTVLATTTTNSPNPCFQTIKPFSSPDKRLTSYILGDNEASISDNSLSYSDWYGDPNYKIYSGTSPGPNRCGTSNPIYLKDDSVAAGSSQVNQVSACVQIGTMTCDYEISISIIFCEQLKHYVYRLNPEELPRNSGFCLEPFKSLLNYITDVEVIIPPPVEEAGQFKYKFRCQFDLATNGDYWYHVTWYRDGNLIKSFPAILHNNDPVSGSVLDETMFDGGLGFKIQCAYAVSLMIDSPTGNVKKSTERFVGIEGDFSVSNGTCYGNGEPHSERSCYICSVKNGVRKWVKSSGGDCDDNDGDDHMLWIIGVVLGAVLIIVIIAVLLSYVVKKTKTRVDSSDIKTPPPSYIIC